MPKVIPPKPSSLSTGVALVGEALGRNEASEGFYFVGEAGQLLDRCFSAAGFRQRLAVNGRTKKLISVSDNGVQLFNVIQERPANNDIRPFVDLTKREPIISPAAETYIEDLRQRIEALRGKINVLVPTGNIALYVLTGILGQWNPRTKTRGSAITNYWNSILPCSLCPGLKVVPMIHPAAALPNRNPLYRYWIVKALQRIKEEGRTPEIDVPKRTLLVNPSFDQAMGFLEACLDAKLPVAHDIETTKRPLITCMSFSTQSDSAICIPFTDETLTKVWPKEQEAQIWSAIRAILEAPEIRKIAHNAAYEFQWMLKMRDIRTVNLDDTMVMQRVAMPDFPSSLGFCCAWYTREPFYKEDDDAYLAGDADILEYWRYNARDSAVLHDLEPELLEELKRIGNEDAYRKTVALLPILGEMQETGIRVNVDGLEEEKANGEREWWKLFGELRKEIPVAPIPKKDYTVFTLDGDRLNGDLPAELYRKDGSLSIVALRKRYGKDRVEAHKSERIFKDYGWGRVWGVDISLVETFPNSDDQKKRYFYEYEDRRVGKKAYLAYKSRKRDAKDKRRIDEYAMRKLAHKGAPGAALINQMAKISKLTTTYLDLEKVDKDGRLRCQFKIGPKTGRLASSANYWGTGANAQNSPQAFKKLLVADD